MTTRAEQLRTAKANERQRRKEAGLVRCEVWVKPEHVAAIKAKVDELQTETEGSHDGK